VNEDTYWPGSNKCCITVLNIMFIYLLMFYLTMLPVAQTIHPQMTGQLVNNEDLKL
jgi:hypothetical protein